MAKNRKGTSPSALRALTKTTLADIVWELAGVAPGCTSCDDFGEVWRIIREAALQVKAPRVDMRVIEQERHRIRFGITIQEVTDG